MRFSFSTLRCCLVATMRAFCIVFSANTSFLVWPPLFVSGGEQMPNRVCAAAMYLVLDEPHHPEGALAQDGDGAEVLELHVAAQRGADLDLRLGLDAGLLLQDQPLAVLLLHDLLQRAQQLREGLAVQRHALDVAHRDDVRRPGLGAQ